MPDSYSLRDALQGFTSGNQGPCPGSLPLTRLQIGGDNMRQDDLMKADLLSEIVLVGSGIAMFVWILLIVVAAITRTAAPR